MSVSLYEDTRNSLLVSNPVIKKQYDDLVVSSKLLSEEEFWSNYGPQYSQSDVNDKQIKGKTSSYFNDMIKINENEWKNVSETKKRNIFKVFPAIQKAYERRDDFNVSEEDFWRRYSFSFRHSSVGIDDLFLRGLVSESGDEVRVASVNEATKLNDECYKSIVDPTVKLQDITDDYYSKSINDSLLQYDDALVKGSDKIHAVRVLTGGWNEYNQQSKLLLESANTHHPPEKRLKTGHLYVDNDGDELNEIDQRDQNPFIALHIFKDPLTKLNQAGNNRDGEGDGKNFDSDSVGGVFGKAVSMVVRTLRKESSSFTPASLLSTMYTVFPSIAQAKTYHRKELHELHSLTSTAAIEAGQGSLSSASTKSNALDAFSNNNKEIDGHDLPDELKQELGEIYVSITERMKHFYVFINREGLQAPTRGSVYEKKVVAIIEDLSHINDRLNAKKTKLLASLPKGRRRFSDTL